MPPLLLRPLPHPPPPPKLQGFFSENVLQEEAVGLPTSMHLFEYTARYKKHAGLDCYPPLQIMMAAKVRVDGGCDWLPAAACESSLWDFCKGRVSGCACWCLSPRCLYRRSLCAVPPRECAALCCAADHQPRQAGLALLVLRRLRLPAAARLLRHV